MLNTVYGAKHGRAWRFKRRSGTPRCWIKFEKDISYLGAHSLHKTRETHEEDTERNKTRRAKPSPMSKLSSRPHWAFCINISNKYVLGSTGYNSYQKQKETTSFFAPC
ncbi:hypothetical protein Y1Q_0014543 [Alligator mississippiensis]|uniref:Uncharacterized protein n=1 Tax=Alligator mississippiensis TaxID=8496 RepID=A0A151PDZ7_ALLMI|nr:hypothetical protein Y1Q_0014543 [Alligator mississippiensis]